MRVRMLGTGSSDGWPNPWCGCRSCDGARSSGVLRRQTSALVDDRLLIEVGHDGVRAAADLSRVEVVLVTHDHPDHHALPTWMWRGWSRTNRPLTVVGPAAVVAAARPEVDPTVALVDVCPGDRLQIGGYDVRVVPATHAGPEVGPAVLYDLTGPDGARLLWATDTGVLSDDALALVEGRAYDAVLLDLTSAHLPAHHDLITWPEQIRALRDVGAVVTATDVCATHLGHDNPPDLDDVLAGWGARAPRDGDVLEVGT